MNFVIKLSGVSVVLIALRWDAQSTLLKMLSVHFAFFMMWSIKGFSLILCRRFLFSLEDTGWWLKLTSIGLFGGQNGCNGANLCASSASLSASQFNWAGSESSLISLSLSWWLAIHWIDWLFWRRMITISWIISQSVSKESLGKLGQALFLILWTVSTSASLSQWMAALLDGLLSQN